MSARRATALTFPIAEIVDKNSPQTKKSGITFTTGMVQISKDGGAFANTTNLPVEISTTGRYTLLLTALEMDATTVLIKIINTLILDVDIVIITDLNVSGAVVSDAGNSATQFKSDLSGATNDMYKDLLCLFTSGTLAEQVKKVSAYNGTTKILTLSAFTGTPSVGDRFVLVNK